MTVVLHFILNSSSGVLVTVVFIDFRESVLLEHKYVCVWFENFLEI